MGIGDGILRIAEEFDVPASGSRQLSRRSVIKAGAHAAWVVPAIQVVGAAPAFAACSARHTHPTVPYTVSVEPGRWQKDGSSDNYFINLVFTFTNRDACDALTGIQIMIEAPHSWRGLTDHSTSGSLWDRSGTGKYTFKYLAKFTIAAGETQSYTIGIQEQTDKRQHPGDKVHVSITGNVVGGNTYATPTFDVQL